MSYALPRVQFRDSQGQAMQMREATVATPQRRAGLALPGYHIEIWLRSVFRRKRPIIVMPSFIQNIIFLSVVYMCEYSDISILKNGAFCNMINEEYFPHTTGEHRFAAKKPTSGSACNRKHSINPGP